MARERREWPVLAIGILIVALVWSFLLLAGQVSAGHTREFDEWVLSALRDSTRPEVPIGPWWLRSVALDITALGSAVVLGLAVLAITGYLWLHGLYRTGLFVLVASAGCGALNTLLKQAFERARPDVVPHLREVSTLSFPSGHALTSAAVCLTLGALLMRIAERPVAKFYCIGIAMLVTLLVGSSRVYLGVHYPTDVLAGWIIGLSWALICWTAERMLERRAGLKRERQQQQQQQQES
jgi:undecaprenyl-diphosphatase